MEKAKPVRVFSSKELAREMQQINDNLANIENNWSVRISSMKRLEGLVLGGSLQFDNFHSLLKSLIIPLTLQLSDRRSSIIRQVCHLLGFLAEELTTSFEFAVEIFIPALLKLVVITIQIIAETADQCIKKLIMHCKISRLLPVLIDTSTKDRSPMIRIRCSNYVLMVLRQWHHTELQKNPELYESFIKASVVDALSEVRANGRVCFKEFSNVWPERSRKLFSALEFSAQKIILEEGYKNQSPTPFKIELSSQKNYNSGAPSPKLVKQIQPNGSQNGLYPRPEREVDTSVKPFNKQNQVSESQSDTESNITDEDNGQNKVQPDFLYQKDEDSKEKIGFQNELHGTNKEVLSVKRGSVNDPNYNDEKKNVSNGEKYAHSNGVKQEENLSRKNNGLLDFFGVLSNFKNKIAENGNENDENAVNNSSPVRTPPPPEKSEPEVKAASREDTNATIEKPTLDKKSVSDFKIKSKTNSELRSEVEFEIGEGLKAANMMLDFTDSSKFLSQIQLSVSSFLSQLKSNNIDQASKIFSSLAKVMPPFLPTMHLTDDVEKSNVLHEFLSLGIRVRVVVDDVVSIGGLDDQGCHAMSRGTYSISSLLSGEPMDSGKVMILWQKNKVTNNQETNDNHEAEKADSDDLAESTSPENMKPWCIEWCMWNSDLPANSSSFLFPICSPSPSNPPLSPPRSLPSPRLSPRLSPRPTPSHSPRVSQAMVSPNSRRLSSPLPSSFASPDSTRKKLSHSSPEFWGYIPDNVKVKTLKSRTFVQSRSPSSIPHITNGGTNIKSSERKISRSCSSSPLMSSIPPPSSSPALNSKSKSRYTHERRSFPADSTSIPNLAAYFSQNNSNPAEVWLVS